MNLPISYVYQYGRVHLHLHFVQFFVPIYVIAKVSWTLFKVMLAARVNSDWVFYQKLCENVCVKILQNVNAQKDVSAPRNLKELIKSL